MALLIALRFVKYCAVAALLGGSMAVALSRDEVDRRRVGLWLVLPGFGVTWVAGFVLAHRVSVSFLSSWVLGAMGASMFSLQALLFSISKPGRRTPVGSLLIVGPLLLAVLLMVWRPE